MKKKQVIQLIKHAIALILCFIVLAPFLVVFFNSLKTESQAAKMLFSMPIDPQWQNYLIVIEKGKLINGFFNSLLYAMVSTTIAVMISAMATYVLARNNTRVNTIIYYFILVGLFFPTSYLPLMRILKLFHLQGTRAGLIVAYTASMLPFCVFVIKNFVSTIPISLDEAAIIDGAAPFQLFRKIMLPLLKPVITTVFILDFMGVWNDFMTPLYLSNSSSMWPMNLAVYNFFGKYQAKWHLVFADIILTTIPVIIVYLIGQKWIISGMTAGAVKS